MEFIFRVVIKQAAAKFTSMTVQKMLDSRCFESWCHPIRLTQSVLVCAGTHGGVVAKSYEGELSKRSTSVGVTVKILAHLGFERWGQCMSFTAIA